MRNLLFSSEEDYAKHVQLSIDNYSETLQLNSPLQRQSICLSSRIIEVLNNI